jgi:8-oxo-dGTP diphosphatase
MHPPTVIRSAYRVMNTQPAIEGRRIGYVNGMGKTNRTPVMAAGGIVIRRGPKPLVAIVQRRKDDAWVLPKGKLKPGERAIAAAKREVMEETGADVRVHAFLGVISYLGGNGPKIVHFWRMRALGSPLGKPMDDIKAVEWLPLSAAIERLTLPHEKSFLRNVGHGTVKRAVKKVRGKPAADDAGSRVVATAVEEKVAALPDAALSAQVVKLQPRWSVLSQLTKRWQAAVGRRQRTG